MLDAGHNKDRNPLTEVEISRENNPSTYEILTDKDSIEEAIIKRNQSHARQSLKTPFGHNQTLAQAVDPDFPSNQINKIIEGTFLENDEYREQLSDIEQEWVRELSAGINKNINTHKHCRLHPILQT
jgi:hypothetical protein